MSTTAQLDAVDFAIAAYREEGVWTVAELTHDHLADLETLAAALRRLPGDHGAVGMVGVDEDFFLLVRVAGSTTRVLLSDVTAADDWDLAGSVVDFIGEPLDEDDDEEQDLVGDLELLADLGVSGMDLALLLDDLDLYPDELLSGVARRLGFGELFDDAVGFSPG